MGYHKIILDTALHVHVTDKYSKVTCRYFIVFVLGSHFWSDELFLTRIAANQFELRIKQG
jgi:hypothetical protein